MRIKSTNILELKAFVVGAAFKVQTESRTVIELNGEPV